MLTLRQVLVISSILMCLYILFEAQKETFDGFLPRLEFKNGEILEDRLEGWPKFWIGGQGFGTKNEENALGEFIKLLLENSQKWPEITYKLIGIDGVAPKKMKQIVIPEKTLFLVASGDLGTNIEPIRKLPSPYLNHYTASQTHFPSSVDFEEKLNKVVWRGSASGIRHRKEAQDLFNIPNSESNELYGIRLNVVKAFLTNKYLKEHGNVHFIVKKGSEVFGHEEKASNGEKIVPASTMSHEEMAEYKGILILDGWGWPGNIKWALKSGSIPLIASDMTPGFLDEMIPDLHYLPLTPDENGDYQESLVTQTKHLLDPTNSQKMKEILQNLKNFVNSHLTKNHIIPILEKSMRPDPGPAQACNEIFFVHVPKTGGGTIEDSICSQDIRYVGQKRAETEFGYEAVNAPASHMLLEENKQLGLGGNFTSFSVVRDPYERFVSETNYRKKSLDEQIEICEEASVFKNHDDFAHCRPQVDYVGVNGEKVDKLFQTHEIDTKVMNFLKEKGALEHEPKDRTHVSKKRYTVEDLTAAQRKWIENKYENDFILIKKLDNKQE